MNCKGCEETNGGICQKCFLSVKATYAEANYAIQTENATLRASLAEALAALEDARQINYESQVAGLVAELREAQERVEALEKTITTALAYGIPPSVRDACAMDRYDTARFNAMEEVKSFLRPAISRPSPQATPKCDSCGGRGWVIPNNGIEIESCRVCQKPQATPSCAIVGGGHVGGKDCPCLKPQAAPSESFVPRVETSVSRLSRSVDAPQSTAGKECECGSYPGVHAVGANCPGVGR